MIYVIIFIWTIIIYFFMFPNKINNKKWKNNQRNKKNQQNQKIDNHYNTATHNLTPCTREYTIKLRLCKRPLFSFQDSDILIIQHTVKASRTDPQRKSTYLAELRERHAAGPFFLRGSFRPVDPVCLFRFFPFPHSKLHKPVAELKQPVLKDTEHLHHIEPKII